jgi:hypothetical protein
VGVRLVFYLCGKGRELKINMLLVLLVGFIDACGIAPMPAFLWV